VSQTLDGTALIVSALLGLAGFFIRAAVGGIRGEDRTALLRGLEIGLLAFFGGTLARGFIGLALALGKDSPTAIAAATWIFFPWAGLVSSLWAVVSGHPLLSRDGLLWFALGVGSFVGIMDGVWRIHPWVGVGVLSFVLDVTWGLTGNLNACLLHVWNFFGGGHALEPRTGAHRYARGFYVKKDFAFTQGSAMSDLPDLPGTPLYAHERTHVWQNRVFGPLFVFSYVGWMLVMLVAGLVAALIEKVNVAQALEDYCYYNNPWEAWGYLVGAGPRAGRGPLIWSDALVFGVAIPFFIAFLGVSAVVVRGVWF